MTTPVVVLGSGRLGRGVSACLEELGAAVLDLGAPEDARVRAALAEHEPETVIVATIDDIEALSYALLVEYLRPGGRLIVTIFDRTIAEQVRRSVSDCTVLSAADLAVPALAGPCVERGVRAIVPGPGGALAVVPGEDGALRTRPITVRASPLRRLAGMLRSQLRPFDAGSRMMMLGALGLAAMLAVDTAIGLALGKGFVDGWYAAVKTIATVGPNEVIDEGSAFVKLLSSLSILLAAGFFAAFTAGLVQRLLDRRLVGLVGRRTIPRDDHVVVVGLGHFGFRLCAALQDLGLRVVAVERNPQGSNVAIAKQRGIPVVIADGGQRRVLERLSLGRARALAAVTSDDVTNVAVSVSALAVRPDLRVVLRAYEGAVSEESQALFHIGVVRDVFALASTGITAAALGRPSVVAVDRRRTHLVNAAGGVEPFPAPAPPLGSPP